MANLLIKGDNLKVLDIGRREGWMFDTVFADPFDNIGLGYNAYKDALSDGDYADLCEKWIDAFSAVAPTVWLSFNAKWTFLFGALFHKFLAKNPDWEGKSCVQVFTFGQHRQSDLGNNHRPLWRLRHKSAPIYPDNIRIPSWRQRNGDKRADSRGRVPGDVFDMQYTVEGVIHTETDAKGVTREVGSDITFIPPSPGDVFDFPRVTGNSKQRCDWHPTQLHEELVERAVKLSTKEGDRVLDPFGGTGTTLRVCEKIGRACTLIEMDDLYCGHIRVNHPDLKFFTV